MAGGRPKYNPSDEERNKVKVMTAVGITQEQIAAVLEIDQKTLRKHFDRELKTAKTEANAKVGQTLFNKAINGDTTAAIWWSKSQMGWKETVKSEHTGEDGGPIVLWGSKDTK